MSRNGDAPDEKTLTPGQSHTASKLPPNPPFYQIIGLLGKGGSGVVYQARDLRLDRDVAIKFLRQRDDRWYERFQREAQALALVDHPGLCRIYEIGEVANQSFLVMQMLHGRTLKEAGLDQRELLIVVREVALALHEVHRAGLIHRDLKPGNIMVCRDGDGNPKPFVLDFGLARMENQSDLTMTGEVMGTPGFMAPEQARGEVGITDLADVYGLGATLYDVLVGKPPFEGATWESVLHDLLNSEPVRPRLLIPNLPREVEVIIMTCLAKEPGLRYQGVQAMADDLGRYLDGRPIEAQTPSLLYRAGRFAKRHKVVVFLAATALILLLASLAWGRIEADRREGIARQVSRELADIENRSRLTFLARGHNIEPRQAELRHDLNQLARLIEARGAATRAAGERALGLGYLAMKDPRTALVFLERSWARGHRSPELVYGLGLAYSLLYREKLSRVMVTEQGQSPVVLAETRRLRQKALFYMKHPNLGDTAPSAYLDALIAFCELRYETALALLDAATNLPPWFYEAEQLRAVTERLWAIQLSRQGLIDEADLHFQRALVAARQAVAIGASDPESYRVLARIYLDILVQNLHRKVKWQNVFPQGLAVLDELEAVLPRDGEAALLRARMWHMEARLARDERGDPSTALAEGEAALAKARALSVEPERVFRFEGALLWLWAQWLGDQRLPATAMLEQAIYVLEQIPEAQRDYFVHFTLGSAYRNLAHDLERKGEDAEWSYNCSIDSLTNALDLQPEGIEAANSLAMTFYHLARVRGDDQELALLKRAESVLSEAREIHDSHPVLCYQQGRVYLALAQAGPGPLDANDCDRALAAFEKAIMLNPRQGRAYERISWLWLLRAQNAWDQGKNYLDFINAGLRICEKGLAMNARLTFLNRNRAYLLYFKGKYALRRGEDPNAFLNEAALAANAFKGSEAMLSRGSIERLRGEWAFLRGEDPTEALSRADAAFDAILKQNPEHAEAHRSLGRLYTLKAAWLLTRGGDIKSVSARADAALSHGSGAEPPWLSARVRLMVLVARSGEPVDTAALAEALSRHENLPEMTAAKACLLDIRGDKQAAETLMKRAYEANPWLRFFWRLQGGSGY